MLHRVDPFDRSTDHPVDARTTDTDERDTDTDTDERDELADDDPFDEPAFSTWAIADHGPDPVPDWLVTDNNALDTELGVLKTGKEADVHLVRREVPDGDGCLLAAKRYRTTDHRMFHRDAGYTEGRSVRRTRDVRAMERRTGYGKSLLAGQWTSSEFGALCELWAVGAPVPYPVQCLDTELMLEFIGDPDGRAAPRLAQCRPIGGELLDLWNQCLDAMVVLARAGYAHGDLSPYNLLVHEGRLVMIDLPQVVDLAANPQGAAYLHRDCVNVCTWFGRRGLPDLDPDELLGDLMVEALGAW